MKSAQNSNENNMQQENKNIYLDPKEKNINRT